MINLLWTILLSCLLVLAIVIVGTVILMAVVSVYRELHKRLRQP